MLYGTQANLPQGKKKCLRKRTEIGERYTRTEIIYNWFLAIILKISGLQSFLNQRSPRTWQKLKDKEPSPKWDVQTF